MNVALRVLFIGALTGAFGIVATPSHAAKFVVIYNFLANDADAFAPNAALLYVNGILYGTGAQGGNSNSGAVFSFDLKTRRERVLHSFAGGPGDGAGPEAALIEVRSTLYGTTRGGGADGDGTVFSLDPRGGRFGILHSFQNNATDGSYPIAALTRVGGMLYGTTQMGGSSAFGTVFAIDRRTARESLVHSFCGGGGDGCEPNGMIYKNSMLYGTTSAGGDHAFGTVFSLDPSTGAESVLYAFQGGADAAVPAASLVHVAGELYGTTYNGGSRACGGNGCGTVFSFDPETRTENVLHVFEFNGTDGYAPEAALLNVSGMLYGTTLAGGIDNLGTVFAIDPATGRERVLHSFTGTADGSEPVGALIEVAGALYGTTSFGGSQSGGTIFKVRL